MAQLNISISEEQVKRMDDFIAKQTIKPSRSALISAAIAEFLKKHGKKSS